MSAIDTTVQAATRSWSPYQDAIFNHFEQPEPRALIVVAVAGSGKTTTAVEVYNRSKAQRKLVVAFNAAIKDELLRRGVNAKTWHGACYSAVMAHKRVKTVTKTKLWDVIEENFTQTTHKLYGEFVHKLVGLGMQEGIGTELCADTPEAWWKVIDHHALELKSEDADYDFAVDLASKVLDANYHDGRISFDDLLYITVRDNLVLQKHDFIIVDEAQDTNKIQIEVMRKLMSEDCQLMMVGDPCQSIYGFRGADSDAMDNLKAAFNAVELPLSVSYRCPVSVVTHARTWVNHIEAAPGAPEGEVKSLGVDWTPATFTRSDLIICRFTAPLVAVAFKLIQAKVGCCIKGRDIGKGLVNLIEKQKTTGIDRLTEKLALWYAKEYGKAMEKRQLDKAGSIQDKYDTLMFLIESLKGAEKTVPGLIRVIDQMFDEKVGVVTLATVHRTKGLEAPVVYWLNSGDIAHWVRQPWQLKQEANLCYVAATRAMERLVLISIKMRD